MNGSPLCFLFSLVCSLLVVSTSTLPTPIVVNAPMTLTGNYTFQTHVNSFTVSTWNNGLCSTWGNLPFDPPGSFVTKCFNEKFKLVKNISFAVYLESIALMYPVANWRVNETTGVHISAFANDVG